MPDRELAPVSHAEQSSDPTIVEGGDGGEGLDPWGKKSKAMQIDYEGGGGGLLGRLWRWGRAAPNLEMDEQQQRRAA